MYEALIRKVPLREATVHTRNGIDEETKGNRGIFSKEERVA